MYIVLVIRPGWAEMRLTRRQTLRCFLSLCLSVSPEIQYDTSVFQVCAIDINYLSVTVCDTINLLSDGYTNDSNELSL